LMTILANLLATGCAILLMRKGPTRRLRHLVLTVGLMSLAQTALCVSASGIVNIASFPAEQLRQVMVGALSLYAVYLLGLEVRDRNVSERRMRLVEHELHSGETIMEGLSRLQNQVRLQLQLQESAAARLSRRSYTSAPAVSRPSEMRKPKVTSPNSEIHTASVQATSDLLTLLSAVTAEERAELQNRNPEFRNSLR